MNIDKNILEVPIEDIIPNRFQPRLSFNEEGINELAESIKQHGIIQPLVVRQLGDKYEIIAGERRYKASTMAGLAKVPVIISDIDDNKSAEVALVENIQRRNLTAIEEAKSYKNLLDRGYLTQEQLANKMGVSQSSIANKLRLLNLDEEVQDALLNEKISERHARALLTLESHEDQKKWLKRIIEERLTVRQLDIELKKLQENGGEEDEGIPLVNINPNLDEIVSHAEDIHVERVPHDVASMLIPEGGIPLEEQKEEPEEPVKSPNKFFNFLEDEQANMSVIEPDEILNTFTSTPTLEPSTEESTTEPQEVEMVQEEQPTPSLEPIEEVPIIEEVKPVVEETNNDIDTIELLEELDTPEVAEQTIEPQEEPTTILESVIPTNLEQSQVEAEPQTEVPNTLEEVEPNPIEETPSLETPKEEISLESLIEPIYMEEPKQEENNAPVIEEAKEEVNPIIEPISTETPIGTEEQNPIVTPQEEIVSTPINEEPIVEITNNQIVEEQPVVEPIVEDQTEELKPFKSIFFNSEEDEEEPSVPVETPVINNTIEEVEPVIEEPLVDPLDSIVTLEPDYQQRQEELAGTDLKTAINVVRDTVSDLERRGFVVECEEADLEDIYHITIKIDKNNK